MGYCSGWSSRKSLIQHLTEPQENFRVVKYVMRGNNMWYVGEVRRADNTWEKFIGLNQIRCYPVKGCSQRDREWGYRAEEESCGPNYYNCPLTFLEEVPCPDSQYARDWRQAVYQQAAVTSKAGLEVGDWLRLHSTAYPYLQVSRLKPFRCGNFENFRVPRRVIAGRAEELTALYRRLVQQFGPYLWKGLGSPENGEDSKTWWAERKAEMADWARKNKPGVPWEQWNHLGIQGPIRDIWLEREELERCSVDTWNVVAQQKANEAVQNA